MTSRWWERWLSALSDGIRSGRPGVIAAAASIVCLLPVSVMFVSGLNYGSADWINHEWSAGYFGEYFKSNFSTPKVFSANPLVGVPVPVFYAYHFYVIAGFVSALFGAAAGMKLIYTAVFALQFVVVYRSFGAIGAGKPCAFLVATVVTWGIYPMTNLYTRGATTEFCGVVFLTCAVVSLLTLILNLGRGRTRWSSALAPGFFFVAAALTHPLTGQLGAMLLFVIGAVAIVVTRSRWLVFFGAGSALAGGLVLSPWIYALAKFGRDLPVNDYPLFALPGIDTVGARFSPVAYDGRSIRKGLIDVSSPYLDAQIMLALCVLAAVLAVLIFMKPKVKLPVLSARLALSMAILFVCTAILARNRASHMVIGGIIENIQFLYRMTSYMNLTALALVLVLASGVPVEKPPGKERLFVFAMGICLALAFCGAVSKLQHLSGGVGTLADQVEMKRLAAAEAEAEAAAAGRGDEERAGVDAEAEASAAEPALSKYYYGHPAYSVPPRGSKPGSDEGLPMCRVDLPVTAAPRFGEVIPVDIDLGERSLVTTNVQPFPWNRLEVDGAMVPPESIIVRRGEAHPQEELLFELMDGQAVLLGPGKHTIGYRFAPELVWQALIVVSWIALIGWCLALCLALFRERRPVSAEAG